MIISLRNENSVLKVLLLFPWNKISIVAVKSHLNMHICHVTIGYETLMGFCIRLMCVKRQTWCHRDQQILLFNMIYNIYSKLKPKLISYRNTKTLVALYFKCVNSYTCYYMYYNNNNSKLSIIYN